MHLGAPARLVTRTLALLAMLGPSHVLANAAMPAFAEGTARSGVSRVSEQTIRRTAGPEGGVRLQVRLQGVDVALDLEPHSLRSAACEAYAEGPGGVRTRLALPPVATYRGMASGGARGVVAATVSGEEVRARILLEDGTDWYVEPVRGRPAGTHAVYRGSEVTETPGACGMEGRDATVRTDAAPTDPALALPWADTPTEALPAPDAMLGEESVSSGCVEAEIAFEADYAFFQRNGSSTSQTIADIEAVMNAVELIYSRDARIGYRITHYLVQTTDGKYSTASATDKLIRFRDWWNANQSSVPRDMAHLMTGVSLTDYIGYASVAVVCDRASAYGLSRSTSSVFANRVGLTAHELGHNWGAGHCNSLEDCRIMCSVINGCDQDPAHMSLGSILEIEAFRNLSASCLGAGTGTPTPLAPTARPDHAVAVRGGSAVIPVLANDFDANCQSVSVGAYPSTSSEGGTVTPYGDALFYRPAPGFVGRDTFTYAARDDAGGQSGATVTVDVQDWKLAEDATGTVQGLHVRYYDVPPVAEDLHAMPVFANPFRVDVLPTLTFPSTNGSFGESGLEDRVGARCTGTLSISQAGTYTFYLTSDDGAKLYVDGLLRIDHDGIHTSSERSASMQFAPGGHTVRVDYYDDMGPAVLRLEWRRGSGPRGAIPASAWEDGVEVAYYQLDSSRLPPLEALVPEKVATVPKIDVPFSWGSFLGSGRSQHVGAVFEGLIVVPTDDVYSFELTSEDGSRLTIGDRVVVDNDGVHNRTAATGGIALRAGAHRARVEYFLREQGCALHLKVWTASMAKQTVPSSWWKRVPTLHVPTTYPNLSAAIAAAPSGSVVWVAPGWYTGPGNRNLGLDGKAIHLVAGGGPALTVLDAQGLGRVFHVVNHTRDDATIEGFTLTGGHGASGPGGAMLLENSTLRVRNCRIQGNTSAFSGAGVAIRGASHPMFENCVIAGNLATGTGGAIQAESGAEATFVGCTVTGNRAGTTGGGAHVVGAASATFDRTILWGNSAGTMGSEAWTADAGSRVQLSCSAVALGGLGGSGSEVYGVANQFANPRFCAPVAASRAPTRGGGYRLAATSPALSSSCGARIGALDAGCAATVTAVEEELSPDTAPRAATLRQNVPNPFNPATRISFALPRAGAVSLRVYDVSGRLVATLVDGSLRSGEHRVTWRGEDENGSPVSSGIYFYRLRTADGVETRSMVLLK